MLVMVVVVLLSLLFVCFCFVVAVLYSIYGFSPFVLLTVFSFLFFFFFFFFEWKGVNGWMMKHNRGQVKSSDVERLKRPHKKTLFTLISIWFVTILLRTDCLLQRLWE